MIRRGPRCIRAGAAILGLAIALTGCASREIISVQRQAQPDLTPEQRREILALTTGTIVGTVREASTTRPVEGVFVHTTRYQGDLTKADGRFRILYLDPGDVTVLAWRRDLIETSRRARVRAGRETTIELFIDHAPPACCRLAGAWSVRFVLREPGQFPAPAGSEATGLMTFNPDIPNPYPPALRAPADDRTLDEFGTYDVDLRPMLGQDIMTTIFRVGADFDTLTEITGHVYNRNEVFIALIPRVSHGGLSLTGTIEGDEVRGTWSIRGLGNVTGEFRMLRKDP